MSDASGPTILVSSYYYRSPTSPDSGWFHAASPMAYVDSVRLAGGVALIAPPLDTEDEVDDALARCDAILLIGGRDLPSSAYGQEPHPRLKLLHPRRSDSDLRLARAALATEKPILGICGGLQAVNVVRGGTLFQHLPEIPELSDPTEHTAGDTYENYHPVRIEAGCRLAAIVGATEVEVNSAHHQAADRIGDGLRAVAWSARGVVEALEGSRNPERFLVLVQWHPERMAVSRNHDEKGARPGPGRPDQLAIFEAFVEAAARRRRKDAGPEQ